MSRFYRWFPTIGDEHYLSYLFTCIMLCILSFTPVKHTCCLITCTECLLSFVLVQTRETESGTLNCTTSRHGVFYLHALTHLYIIWHNTDAASSAYLAIQRTRVLVDNFRFNSLPASFQLQILQERHTLSRRRAD